MFQETNQYFLIWFCRQLKTKNSNGISGIKLQSKEYAKQFFALEEYKAISILLHLRGLKFIFN